MKRTLLLGITITLFSLPVRGQEPFQFDRRTPVVQVVERFGDCVLSVSTTRLPDRNTQDPFSRIFGTPRPTGELGSGVIIDPAGYVITNAHVVYGSDEIRVKLLDGSEYVASLLSSDVANDLALLKIDSNEPFSYVPLGRSEDVMIGETVIALGNPYGLTNTVTTGVLSAKDRSVPTEASRVRFADFLQTDASINPGNSGGALLNINGELIGINTAITRQGQGIGFAIPVDRVRKVLPDLLDLPVARGLSIGAEFDTTDEGTPPAIVVTSVDPDAQAARFGLRRGDQVERVDGRRVESLLDLKKRLLEKRAGDTLALSVRRGSLIEDIELPVEPIEQVMRRRFLRKLGFWGEQRRVRTRGAGMIEGFLVNEVREHSPATQLGLREDDVIYKIAIPDARRGQLEISTSKLDLFQAVCEHSRPGDELTIYILRRGERDALFGPLIVQD